MAQPQLRLVVDGASSQQGHYTPSSVAMPPINPQTNARIEAARRMVLAQEEKGTVSIESCTNSTMSVVASTPHYIAPATTEIAKPQPVRGEIRGRVRRINPKNRKVFWVWTEGLQKEFKCYADFFCPVREGDALHGYVEVEQDSRYGQQLKFIRHPFVEIGMDKDSVIRCMLKILVGTGFGNIKAHELYSRFDDLSAATERSVSETSGSPEVEVKAQDRIMNYISELAHLWNSTENEGALIPLIPIITELQAKKFLGWWYKNCNLRRLYLLGLTNKIIRDCHMSCDDIYKRCLENPFTVVQIPIDRCYNIWERIGKTFTPQQERCAVIARKIYEHTVTKAWTGSPSRIIAGLFPDSGKYMPMLIEEYGVKGELFTIYLEYPYRVETGVASKIFSILTRPDPRPKEHANFLKKTLDREQMIAIQGALDNRVSIITGGAGCGKTTIIGEVVHNLEIREIPYIVASFTGKAVARIREVIRRKSPATMHRLISRASAVPKFKKVIIDEASMVTTELLWEFGQAFDWDFDIIFVGDPNQLQPIGWGSLFKQLISSGLVPTFKLEKNHRSDVQGTNGIINNSCGIINYHQSRVENPADSSIEPFTFESAPNFVLMDGNIENVFDIVRALYRMNILSDNLTIISPYNKYLDHLNQTYQQIYNDGKAMATDCKGTVWMIGDRVMMKENNYDINVMNGEEGNVTDLVDGPDGEILVTFKDGSQHRFKLLYSEDEEFDTKKDQLTVKMLRHSFAVTVHTAQGSEWEFVIIFIPPSTSTHGSFLNNTLAYTAVTRARKAVWVVGDIDSFNTAAVTEPPYRCDNLSQRLTMINSSAIEGSKDSVTVDLSESSDVVSTTENTVGSI